MSTIELFQSCLVVSNIQINQVFFYFWHTYLVYYIYVSKYQKKIASMLAISVFLRKNNIAINGLTRFFLLLNNYFLCPNLEKGVALFVGSVKSTFPLHFGSETSKTWEKTSENVWFSSGSEKITFSRVFSHVLQVSDPKWNGTSWFYTTANIGYSLNKN